MRRATKLKRQTIENWLKTQDTYTLHKPIRRKFQRRRVIVGGKNHQFQADLIDLRALRNKNDGVSYLLTCIDVFSKYAYVIPLKRKTGRSLVKAFETIFKTGEVPLRLQTDKGTEFRNRLFQTFLKKHNVHFFVSQNDDIKAAIVERFNRTLKERMWRYFTKHNTKRYVDILPNLVKSYNKTYHRSIKLAPAQVTSANQEVVWQNFMVNKHPVNHHRFSAKEIVCVSVKQRNSLKKDICRLGRKSFLSSVKYAIKQLLLRTF